MLATDEETSVDLFVEGVATPLTFNRKDSIDVQTKIFACEIHVVETCRKHYITIDDDQYHNIISYLNEGIRGVQGEESEEEDLSAIVQTRRGRKVRLPSRYTQ